MSKKSFKTKAFGLVEVLIGLAIFGTAIIAATSITVRSLRIVKDNEIADTANGVMMRTLEYAKFEDQAETPKIALSGASYKEIFYLVGTIDNFDEISYSNPNLKFSSETVEINNQRCIENTGYQIIMNVEGINSLVMCNQITFEKIPSSNNYQVKSKVIFKTAQSVRTAEVTGIKIVSQ